MFEPIWKSKAPIRFDLKSALQFQFQVLFVSAIDFQLPSLEIPRKKPDAAYNTGPYGFSKSNFQRQQRTTVAASCLYRQSKHQLKLAICIRCVLVRMFIVLVVFFRLDRLSRFNWFLVICDRVQIATSFCRTVRSSEVIEAARTLRFAGESKILRIFSIVLFPVGRPIL